MMSIAITKFWSWFEVGNKAFINLSSPNLDGNEKVLLLDSILNNLHQYCDKLFFEIGGSPGEDQELIITADGDVDFFSQVESLINNAPKIEGWVFTAFMQPRELDYIINFEDVEIKPHEVWFLPLDNKNAPKSIGLRICLPNYQLIKDNKWLQAAVYRVLDTILGEKAFSLDIDYVDIKSIPEGNLEEQGLMELKDLSAFVKWKKAKVASL